MKIYSKSLITREMKIKSRVRYHYMHKEEVKFKRLAIVSLRKDVQQLEFFFLIN